jgi:hypothetical protein
MTETVDADLYKRVAALLEPGDIRLNGFVLHTDLTTDEESVLHKHTVETGDIVAEHATEEDTYVYSGNDDPDFGLNQHQGLTLTGDEFVWECQQLLRDGTYDVVFYYEASADHEAICEAVEAHTGFRVVGVEG